MGKGMVECSVCVLVRVCMQRTCGGGEAGVKCSVTPLCVFGGRGMAWGCPWVLSVGASS